MTRNKKLVKIMALAVAASTVATSVPAYAAFDATYYAQQNPDVVAAIGTNPADLETHYNVFGKKEGRAGSVDEAGGSALRQIFDAEFYAKMNPDVVAVYGKDANALFNHFLQFGIKEGRGINPYFDVNAYKKAYPDLVAAFGDDIAAYYNHFATNGIKEHRTLGGFPAEKIVPGGVAVASSGSSSSSSSGGGSSSSKPAPKPAEEQVTPTPDPAPAPTPEVTPTPEPEPEPEPEVDENAPKLEDATLGVTETLGLVIENQGSLTIKSWNSSNLEVASVSSTGIVAAKKEGTAVITAKLSDDSEVSCTITVVAVNLKMNSELEVAVGEIERLTAAPVPSAGIVVSYTTSNPEIATVNTTGDVKGIKEGTAIITATATESATGVQKATASCVVTVKTPYIKLDKSTLNLEVDDTHTFEATTLPSGQTVTFNSSDPTIATVDSSGLVTAIKEGEATITASFNLGGGSGTPYKAECKVIVSKVTPGITLDESDVIIDGATTETVGYTIKPTGTTIMSVESSDDNIATVANSGSALVITGKKAGKVKVTATIKVNNVKYTASCNVTVRSSLEVSSTSVTLCEDDPAVSVTATANAFGASPEFDWVSYDPTIATVSASAGTATITPVGVGETIVSVTVGGETKEITVTVNPVPRYTITYNLNGGSGTAASVTANRGAEVSLHNGDGLTGPDSKAFAGWATSDEAVSANVSSPYTLAGDVTLYAVWE